MLKDYLSLAIKNLKHRGIRSWLTMLGIFIGVATVVALISLGNGLQTAITTQFTSISVNTLIIENSQTSFGAPGSSSVKALTKHDLDIISQVSGIEDVIPRILRNTEVIYNNKLAFEYVISIPNNQKQIDDIYNTNGLETDQGRLLRGDDSGKVVLGSTFTDSKIFNKQIKVGSHIKIQGQEFSVVGILKPTNTFQVNSAILMDEKDLKNILNIGDQIDFIVVQIKDEKQLNSIASQIQERLRKDRNEKSDEEDFTIQTPQQALSTISTILTIINIIITGMATISLVVGGIGIANTMYASVLERTREIGIMKSVGAKNSEVLSIFLAESALLGLVGGIVGAIIGLLMAFSVSMLAANYFKSNIIQVQISWPILIIAISFSLLIGIISGLIPSYQASRLKPVDAIRQ